MIAEGTVPVYQTLSFWDLVEPGTNTWKSVFPFDAPGGIWTFSGRVALHLGLPSLQLPAESTVLVPNYFQGVEIDTLLHHKHKLEFYRVDAGLQVDLDDVATRLSPSVSALHIIHYFGWPQDMQAIVDFCTEHDLRLIEDCALSLFSRDAKAWLGSYGDLSLFSVYKTLALPHGGFLVLKEGRAEGSLRRPAWSTVLTQTTDLLQQHMRATGWGHVERGVRHALGALGSLWSSAATRGVTSGGATWEPRLLEFGASTVIPGLMRSMLPDRIIATRRRNFFHLANRLAEVTHHPLGALPDHACPLFYPIRVKSKLEVMARLAELGVGSVNLWWEPHPACPQELAREVAPLRNDLLELPIHQSLSIDDIERVAESYLKVTRTG